jgi:putative tricarboxylic transport membrane protein
MDFLQPVWSGLTIALDPLNLVYCFVGTFLGTLIGVLPGIGPAATIALLLPITFKLSSIQATIMLAGIYYGSMYGGSTTSILVNIPGEVGSVVTCLDGYEMAKKGRAGPALGISAIGSFIGGTLSVVGLMVLAVPLSAAAIKFGPPEYFSLMLLGMTMVIYLAQKSFLNGLIMAILGMMFGTVGMDIFTAQVRFGFGITEIMEGIDLVPLLMGLFGISEVMINMEQQAAQREIKRAKFRDLFPTLRDWADSKMAIVRGTVIGFLLGVLPGGGVILASFTCYAVEKKFSKHPEKFGTGVIEGVASPETANNAAATGAFVPLFVLGIPANVVAAMLLSVFMIHGLQPGPMLIKHHPTLFWGTVMSMYIGNVMCLIFNLPMISLWVQLLRVPYKLLYPLIILFCTIGAYSVNFSIFDIFLAMFFGLLGYFLRKGNFELAPLVLAFILSRLMEQAFRQSLTMSDGSFWIFFSRPISAIAMIIASASLLSAAIPGLRKRRSKLVEQIDD